MNDRIAQIEARLSTTSPGPWEASKGANADGKKLATTGAEKAAFLALSVNDNESPLWLVVTPEVIPAATGDGPRAEANAEFIANAPADIAYLLNELQVRDEAAQQERERLMRRLDAESISHQERGQIAVRQWARAWIREQGES